ncbi:unnamed protein product, partial [Prorocentrum cordatum]
KAGARELEGAGRVHQAVRAWGHAAAAGAGGRAQRPYVLRGVAHRVGPGRPGLRAAAGPARAGRGAGVAERGRWRGADATRVRVHP